MCMLEVGQEHKFVIFGYNPDTNEWNELASASKRLHVTDSQRWCYILKPRLGRSHGLFRVFIKEWVEKFAQCSRFILFSLTFCSHFLHGIYIYFYGVLYTCSIIYIIALLELMKSKYWSPSKETMCSAGVCCLLLWGSICSTMQCKLRKGMQELSLFHPTSPGCNDSFMQV